MPANIELLENLIAKKKLPIALPDVSPTLAAPLPAAIPPITDAAPVAPPPPPMISPSGIFGYRGPDDPATQPPPVAPIADAPQYAVAPIPDVGPVAPDDPANAAVTAPPMIEPNPTEARLRELEDPGRYEKGGAGRNEKWSTTEKVLSAIAGWAMGGLPGGIQAATDRNFFNKMHDQNQLARLRPAAARQEQSDYRHSQTEVNRAKPGIAKAELKRKYDVAKQNYDARMAAIEAREKEGKREVDSDGLVWWRQKNGNRTPVMTPDGSRQEKDPSKELYEWTDPTSGQTVRLQGNQLATVGATIAAGNAQREQGAATTNANNQLEAARANIANTYKYNSDVLQRADAIAKQTGEAIGNQAEMQGLQDQLNQAGAALDKLDPDANEKEYAAATKQFNDIQEKFYQAIGKTTSGAKALQQMQESNLQRPATITAPTVRATKVTVPKHKDPLGLFR